MHHQILNINEYRLYIDYTVENTLKPFKEEVLDQLYSHHLLNTNMPLLFSGGMDSTFILRSLIELGIKPKLVTMSFTTDNDDNDCNRVKSIASKYGVSEPEFFYIDRDKLLRHVHELVYERKIAYPMLHGFYMSYLLNTIQHTPFYTGMGSEYKLKDNLITMPFGPQLVKQNNPNRLFDFTTSRTFLSYLAHEQFLINYQAPVTYLPDGRIDAWYTRDLIYQSCYPDIDIVKKQVPRDRHIADHFYSDVEPYLRENLPLPYITSPYIFNVDEYFKRKGK